MKKRERYVKPTVRVIGVHVSGHRSDPVLVSPSNRDAADASLPAQNDGTATPPIARRKHITKTKK
jgi:hypothetical protein